MSLFQSNLRKQIRNLPKILNFVKKFTIIVNYSLHSLIVRLGKSDGREIDRLRVDLLHPGGILRLRAHLDLEGVDLQEEGGLCAMACWHQFVNQ